MSPTASPTPARIPLDSLAGTLVYSSEVAGNDDIYLLRLDGSAPIRLTEGPEKEFDPDLSSDGTTIVYRRNPVSGSDTADIWSMNIDGTNKRNLTNDAPSSNWAPTWTPDGRIAYSSMRARPGTLELWIMNADGSGAVRVSQGWCEYAQPSPDGSAFVCAANAGGRYDLVVVSATGERRSLTSTPVTEFGPSWSPDGSWIAFSREIEGHWVLMEIRPDGTGERQIADEGVFSTWDPAGHLVWSGPGGINVANADGSGRINLDYPAAFISWGAR